ncbi:hypothetical protein BC628DRAFT_1368521 [Trametes gibbosa]|nr:hypothetical protein BC628DRAFT_1368521 [Trametes gibbosa]
MPALSEEAHGVGHRVSRGYQPRNPVSPADSRALVIQDSLQIAFGVALVLALSFALVGCISLLLSRVRSCMHSCPVGDDDDDSGESLDSPYANTWMWSVASPSTSSSDRFESRPTSAADTPINPAFDLGHLLVSSNPPMERSGDALGESSYHVEMGAHTVSRPVLRIVPPNRATTSPQPERFAVLLPSFISRASRSSSARGISAPILGEHSDYTDGTSPRTLPSSSIPENHVIWDAPELCMFPPPYRSLQPAASRPDASMRGAPSQHARALDCASVHPHNTALSFARHNEPSAFTRPGTYANTRDDEDEIPLAQTRTWLLYQNASGAEDSGSFHSHGERPPGDVRAEAARCPASPPPSYQESV